MCAGLLVQGKVRDVYELDDRLVIVTTDRQSAFDRILAAVPFKVRSTQQTMVTPKWSGVPLHRWMGLATYLTTPWRSRAGAGVESNQRLVDGSHPAHFA